MTNTSLLQKDTKMKNRFSQQQLMRLTSLVVVSLTLLCASLANAETLSVSSPDGKIIVKVSNDKSLTYSVVVDGAPLINNSQLDLVLDGVKSLAKKTIIVSSQTDSVQETLTPEVRVKSATISNNYNQLMINFDNKISLNFRAFNNGVAYRFETHIDGNITVNKEVAEFNFSAKANVYYPEEEGFYSHNERQYIYQSIGDISKKSLASTPALVDAGTIKVVITETGLEDYPGLWLLGNGNDGLQATFANFPLMKAPEAPWIDRNEPITKRAKYLAKTAGQRTFPWRVFAIARNDAELITNQLTYQLASPNRIGDTSWIKPGKVAWDWFNSNNLYGVDFKAGVNTQTYKYYIDFAAQYGIEYVILDEGWYPLGDLLGTVDDMDVPAIIAHAKSKGVNIILWASWLTLRDQFDAAMDRIAELGAVGIKPDFFQRDDQEMVNFYWKIADAAAKRHLMVDFHGAYKPAGLRRTYPNVISREGVRGMEWNKWSYDVTPEHNTTIPFIRMVAGPMDYTPGAMSNAHGPLSYKGADPDYKDFAPRFDRPMSQTTRAHQIALLTVFESPLQMMADTPTQYQRESESTEFMAQIPTVWDETVALDGKVGDYLALARRSDKKWFVGAINDENARTLKFDLSFLETDKQYQMTIIEDGINADHWAEDYKKTTLTVTSKDMLDINMAAAGGYSAIISLL
jgi:alpha-glucosidase